MEALEGATPQLLQTLRPHGTAGEVTCCDVTPDGARLLTGGGDRALRVWRWERGEGWVPFAAVSRAHRYGLTACRWAPGGALAASGGVDGAARVWSGRELAPRRLLAAPAAPALRALCWAGAGVLLCGYDDGTACAWHVQRGVMLARLHAHEGSLHALAAPACGALLIAACTDGVLKAFDFQAVVRTWSAGEPPPAPLLWVDGAHDMGALCCESRGDGSAVATGGQDARVRLWAVRGAGRTRRVEGGAVLAGHGAAVTAVRWARSLLASASFDRTARFWSAEGACLLVLHAHPRYLTCIALAPDLRYLITGSNDKSVRMWSISDLTLDDDLEPACEPLAHFAVGDLEGIDPVDEEALLAGEGGGAAREGEAAGAARLVWRSLDAHAGAVNCITVHGDLLATACSDGVSRIFQWNGEGLKAVCEVGERGYPALAAELSAGGAGPVLLVAGFDGAARLWDVESGCMLRSVSAPSGEGEGGGGVRGARVSPQRPALLLLATDDGTAPLWSLADTDPEPLYVYEGLVEGAMCCAWSGCGRVCAVGGAGGELRVMRAPPAPAPLCLLSDVHEIAVQSCDFAPSDALELSTESMMIATVGCDALIKLWQIDLDEECCSAAICAAGSAIGHSGGASSVRWGRGGSGGGWAVLVSAGADGWARVWQVTRDAAWRLRQLAAVPALGAAGSPAAALLEQGVVALGSLAGELSVWRLGEGGGAEGEAEGSEGATDEDAGLEPRWWGLAGVTRWLRDYVTRHPEAGAECAAAEEALVGRAAAAALTGARLLDDPLPELLDVFGYDEESAPSDEAAAVRARLLDELRWLRRPPPPEHFSEADGGGAVSVPHGLRCPVSHALQREPSRAADGLTYDRATLYEWFLAADGAVSALSGRALHSGRVAPNYRARDALRLLLQQHYADTDTDTNDLDDDH